MSSPDQILQTAIVHYKNGNIPQAECLCRYLISLKQCLPDAYNLLGMVSMSAGLTKHAAKYFQAALRHQSSHSAAKKNLKLSKKALKQNKLPRSKSVSLNFLLIKSWGNGFWSDMDHVLGQLLLAEITGRVPIVHWGANSLYHDPSCDNAFDLYFEPVSDYKLEHLVTNDFSYFPPKWSRHNLASPEKDKWEGPYSRMAGFISLAREENVVVSDFHTYVNDLLPWLNSKDSLYGMDAQQVYRFLITRYLKLKPDIQDEIDQFWGEHIKDREVLAIHARGSDKITESPELHSINEQYITYVEKFLDSHPDMAIFLLTDSVDILDIYKKRYPGKLIYNDCLRSKSDLGVHYHQHDNRKRMGIEIIKDTYLAAKCDYFIGYGGTNVSTTILHLKDWQQDEYVLLGENRLFEPHLFLHNR